MIISEKKRRNLEPRGAFRNREDLEFCFVVDGDLLLTKITDFEDLEISNMIAKSRIPQLVSVDRQKVVCDRLEIYSRLNGKVDFAETRAMGAEDIDFPVIIKSRLACGPAWTHLMAIARNSVELAAVRDELKGELLTQQFIFHSEKLYKVFCIGDAFFAFSRPTLSPKINGVFDSQTAFKNLPQVQGGVTTEELNTLSEIGRLIDKELGLRLFGFDAVRNEMGRFVVVDVNYFPSFNEVQDFPDLLAQLLLSFR